MPPRTVGPLLALLAASQFLPAAEPVVSSAPATPAPLERADPRLVPTPRARALPASATNRPFLAAARARQPVDLAALGYTETEYIVRGFASIYDWVGAPHEAAVGVKAAGIPYATRILVRRPRDAARASGRVVVELLNPTGLYDFAPLWGFSWQHFTRSGDVWVGVTVKPVAAATLKRYDPVRYADISFAYAQPPDCRPAPPRAGLPGAGDPRVNPPDAENGLAWDITAQVGALLRSSSKENPLLDISPRHIIAAGYSQTGGYVVTFANGLHRVLRLGDGRPVFDGYLNAAGANAAPINQCAAPLLDDDPRRRVLPRDVPFITAMTESDFNRMPQLRREDSDEPDDLFRLYEIAGSGHAGPFAAGVPSDSDLAIAGFDPPAEGLCEEPAGEFPVGLAFNAIWQQYADWLAQRLPFSRQPRIETDAAHRPVRDAQGNARGGWRLPQIEVPLAAYAGSGTPREATDRARTACALTGVRRPFTTGELRELYGSRAAWLERFRAAVDAAVADRRLTAADAESLKATAARAVPAF
jgi:hypothetical protein|nr:MAG: hypothetical protein DIU62_02640 [Pseudomonadota bacterium]